MLPRSVEACTRVGYPSPGAHEPVELFSHMNTTGSRHSDAMLSASKLTPSSSAPSPKNGTETEPSRALLAGIAGAHADPDAAADDAGSRDEAEVGLAQVDGAAAPAEQSRGAAEDLRHGAAGVGAARQHVPVVAMGGGELVAPVERRHHGDAGRLLADIEMIVADELALTGKPQHGLLEAADEQHALDEGPGEIVGKGHGGTRW